MYREKIVLNKLNKEKNFLFRYRNNMVDLVSNNSIDPSISRYLEINFERIKLNIDRIEFMGFNFNIKLNIEMKIGFDD